MALAAGIKTTSMNAIQQPLLLMNSELNYLVLLRKIRNTRKVAFFSGLLHIELNCLKRNALHCLPEISARAFNSSQA
jgi:hypothetical protein